MRDAAWLPLVLVLAACGGAPDADVSSASPAAAGAMTRRITRSAEPAPGARTFAIVPEKSTASYIAEEEFFALALSKFGIPPGRATVVGSTQAVEGQFQIDPSNPTGWLGENVFTVQMDTFTTDRPERDAWIREDGPRFYEYPLATFRATEMATGTDPYRPGEAFSVHLIGTITIREIPQPITFAVRAMLDGDTLTGAATSRLRMSDFGIEPLDFYNTLTVADEIGLELQFTARAGADGAGPAP